MSFALAAIVCLGLGAPAHAEPTPLEVAESELHVVVDEHGRDAQELVDPLLAVANARAQVGDHEGAVTAALRAVEISETVFGFDHVEVAYPLSVAGIWLLETGELDSALDLFERQLAIRLAHDDPDSLPVARGLANVAEACRRLGRLGDALEMTGRSAAIFEAVLGPDDAELGHVLSNLAVLQAENGDWADAAEMMARSVSILEAKLGPDHGDLAIPLLNLAALYSRTRRFEDAATGFARAEALITEHLDPNHPYVAICLNNLGQLQRDMGDLLDARDTLERALAIHEQTSGLDHINTATTLTHLSTLQGDLGNGPIAAQLIARAASIFEHQLGPDHPDTLHARDSMAAGLIRAGRFDEAIVAYREIVAAQENTEQPWPIAQGLNNLGTALLEADRLEEAEVYLRRGLAVLEESVGDTVSHAHSLFNMGRVLQRQHRHEEAAEFFLRSVEVTELLPGWASARQRARTGYAQHLVHMHRSEEGHAVHRTVLADSLMLADITLFGLVERDAFKFIVSHHEHLDKFLLTTDNPLESWAAVLDFKGMVTRRLTARALSFDDPVQARIHSLRREVAQLALSSSPDVDRIGALIAEREELERQLGAGAVAAEPRVEPADICAALPDDTVLIDTIKILNGPGSYIALVVHPDRCNEVRRIKLGAALPIEAAIASWREGLATRDARTGQPMVASRIDARGERVRELIWDPLTAAIGDVKRVIIAPDAVLNEVPFAALPVGDHGYLIEQMTVSYVEQTRDILRKRESTADGVLLVGDVDFGALGSKPSAEGLLAMREAPCVDRSWTPLPGTATAVTAVADVWRKRRKTTPSMLLEGAATESAVYTAAGEHGIVHLATHGFQASDCPSALASAAGYNPMLLSGLVLAGANVETGGETDGILTAEEVATLDLSAVELVVLSACETGLGESSNGEGVLGLRRAFAAAGAGTLISSLWSVPDDPTATLMTDFYKALLRKRRAPGPAEALRQAQLEALETARRTSGDGRPSDWAAFVPAGM